MLDPLLTASKSGTCIQGKSWNCMNKDRIKKYFVFIIIKQPPV